MRLTGLLEGFICDRCDWYHCNYEVRRQWHPTAGYQNDFVVLRNARCTEVRNDELHDPTLFECLTVNLIYVTSGPTILPSCVDLRS